MRIVFNLFMLFCFLNSCKVDKRAEAIRLLREGERLEASSLPNSALDAYREAAILSAAIEDHALQSEIQSCLGDVFLLHGVYDRAIEAYRQAAGYAQRIPEKSLLARAYRGIGRYHYYRGEMKEALSNFLLAQEQEKQVGSQEEISSIYNNLSTAYTELGDYEKALQCNTKAMLLTTDSLKFFRNCAVRGKLFTVARQYDSAFYYISLASRSNDARIRASSYYKLSDMPIASGITDSMKYIYLSWAKQLTDSIEDINRSVQVIESEHLYQLKSLEDKAQNRLLHIFVFIAGAIVVVTLWIYSRYKHKTNKYQQIIDSLDLNNRELSKEREMNETRWEKQLVVMTIGVGNSCVERFVATPFYEKLKMKLRTENGALTYEEQDELRQVVFETFEPYTRQLSEIINKLSANDSLLCCLSLLKLTTKECAVCRGVSSETIRSQRTRFKRKIPRKFLDNGLFDLIFGEE